MRLVCQGCGKSRFLVLEVCTEPEHPCPSVMRCMDCDERTPVPWASAGAA